MLGISVRQPWAWTLAEGLKPVENRGSKRYSETPSIVAQARKQIGQQLAIHSSKWWGFRRVISIMRENAPLFECIVSTHDPYTDFSEEPMIEMEAQCGQIIAVGTLVEIIDHEVSHPLNRHPFRNKERFALVFENMIKLREPVAAKGALGLWTVTWDAESAIAKQL